MALARIEEGTPRARCRRLGVPSSVPAEVQSASVAARYTRAARVVPPVDAPARHYQRP